MTEKTVEYAVMTANPDLVPLMVYEIERGTYPTLNLANLAATRISQEEGVKVQVFARQWRIVSIPMHEPHAY